MKDMLSIIPTRKPGAKEEDIKAAEEKLGAAFPEQYRELCKLVNNAEIGEWILYPIKDKRNLKKTWDDVVRQNTLAREEGISEHLIVIADDGSGDRLCFKATNGQMGNILYIWDHETEEIEEYAPDLKQFILSEADEGR
ncbi:SMI1/KNR4 family protein [Bacillus marinisedimentorum]|uniref:SMI1/KNR4 family protein n=1 Tax=Bacillus marinisedimentorum TaxID=1821260 RepID=UPI0007E288C1|nr:SMI1/KNR4 family protein [Bacillus marinisedimentorum]